MKLKLTTWIFLAMLAGIGVGWMCHELLPTPESAKTVAGYISLFTDVFLRLIKMIIAPLVFSTLVVGIAHMGDTASIGRIGIKTMAWFVTASLISLLLGMFLVNILRPGDSLSLPLPDASASTNLKVASLSLKEFVTHLVPRSVFEAMANNEILQIVIFAVFFGAAASALGEKTKALVAWVEELSHVMLKVTAYVMALAPVAVFAAMASIVTTQGLGVLWVYGKFMGEFYLGIVLLWGLIALAGFFFLGPRIAHLIDLIKEPILLAFSTASSEAAYPKTLEQLERFGASKKITSFVLPLGYSFNLDGSMMYCTFATLFIAQAYNIHLSLGTQVTMMLILMLTSKGMAGVPRASLVVIAATLNQFNIPEAGLLLILGVDTFLDMGRSATNAVGNSIASAVVAKWEGELMPERDADRNAKSLDTNVAPMHLPA
jgi:Na+/H+-dicarboxylate symporter